MDAKHHINSRSRDNRRLPESARRLARVSIVACATAMWGCGSAGYKGELYDVDNYYGAIAGDEPRAVLIGRNLMASGGNAVDALVGAYFAMAATLPSTAGLGGGGVCVVHSADEDKRADEVLDFLPRSAAAGQVAVPGNVRGMAALAARYGKLPWAQLVSPAEELANRGTPVSRALAHDIALSMRKLSADPNVAALFFHADGSPLSEGDNLVQPELGSVLAQVRAKGVAEIHGGLTGQRIASAAQSIGAPLTAEDLRGFLTQFVKPLDVKLGDQTVHLPQPPASGGVSLAQMLVALRNGSADDPVFAANASQRLAADRANWLQPGGEAAGAESLIAPDRVQGIIEGPPPTFSGLPENPFSASLVAADRDGLAAACSFTMNALFGSGRMAPGTGMILSPAPDERGFGFSALAPMVMANEYNGEFYFASSARGGLVGALAEAMLLQRVWENKESLESAMLRPRAFFDPNHNAIIYDVATGQDPGPQLQAAGITAEENGNLGNVSAIFCPLGAPADPETCQVRADHRGNGLASVVTKD